MRPIACVLSVLARVLRFSMCIPVLAIPMLLIAAFVVLFPGEHSPQTSTSVVSESVEWSDFGAIHAAGQMRTVYGNDFSKVMPTGELQPIEVYVQQNPNIWSWEMPGWIAIQTQSQIVTRRDIHASQTRITKSPAYDPIDSWLGVLVCFPELVRLQEMRAHIHGERRISREWTDASGHKKTTIRMESIRTNGADPRAPIQSFFDSRTIREFTIDAASGRLDSIRCFTKLDGREIVIFEIDQIGYGVLPEMADSIESEFQRLMVLEQTI